MRSYREEGPGHCSISKWLLNVGESTYGCHVGITNKPFFVLVCCIAIVTRGMVTGQGGHIGVGYFISLPGI